MTSKATNDTTNSIHRLSIQVGLNGLSFCTLNVLNSHVDQLQHRTSESIGNPEQLLERATQLIDDESLSQRSFRDVTVIHVNELSAFVPKPFFNKDKLADYLKFNNKILGNDYIDYDMITNNEMVNVYVPYMNVNNFFIDVFGEFEYRHFSSILVEKLLNNTPYQNEATVYVHLQPRHFEVVVVKQKKLLLYNSFSHTTKEDFIYYILFIAEQLQLDPETLQLQLLGDISEESELYEILYTYVRDVRFVTIKNPYSFEDDVAEKLPHQDFVLLNSFA